MELGLQAIGLGNAPNDNLGDKLRDGGVIINANFAKISAAIHNLFNLGPVTGNDFDGEFAIGIHKVYLVPQSAGYNYYICCG